MQRVDVATVLRPRALHLQGVLQPRSLHLQGVLQPRSLHLQGAAMSFALAHARSPFVAQACALPGTRARQQPHTARADPAPY
jgi:hypothetical protein